MNEKLNYLRGKPNIKNELLSIKTHLSDLEQILNTIELETSLLNTKNSETCELNI